MDNRNVFVHVDYASVNISNSKNVAKAKNQFLINSQQVKYKGQIKRNVPVLTIEGIYFFSPVYGYKFDKNKIRRLE